MPSILSMPANPLNPFPGSPFAPFGGDSLFEKMEREVRPLDALAEKADKLNEKLHEARLELLHFIFDYTHCGFTFADDYLDHYEKLPIPTFSVDDPYGLCVGILLLCSPDAMHSLYVDIHGANVEKDLNLPWLTGIMCGVARDVASHLP